MSDPRGHDHLPDQAALDELIRAFADPGPPAALEDRQDDERSDGSVEPGPLDEHDDRRDDGRDGEHADELDEHADELVDHDDHDDFLITDAGEVDASAEPESTSPSLIRIDDLAGSVVIEPSLAGPAGEAADGDAADDVAVVDDVDDVDDSDDLDADDTNGDNDNDANDANDNDANANDNDDNDNDDNDNDDNDNDANDNANEADDRDGSPRVISIDDEELPDAVYVEGSLDRDGSRSIVIIEDDDTGDTLGPDSERDIRRGIEPRMRERRVAVKRAQGRKRLKWVALVAVVVLLVVGVLAVLGSPLFAIREDRITITGNVYADPAAVQAVIDDLVGTPSLRADTQRAERDLEAIPWVDQARVRVDFPYSASIEIREREAWTTYQGPDQRFRVLDRDGRVLDVLDGYPFAYVLITGPDPVDLDPGEFAPRGYAAASGLAKTLTGSVRTRVESIQVTADGSRLSLLLDDGTEVLFGEARDLLAKLVRLETVLTSGEERAPGLIDVSTREVTVPPSGSGQDDG